MTTRRHFLTIGSAATILAALIPGGLLLNRSGTLSLENLHAGQFTALVNSEFLVNEPSAEPVALKLVTVKLIDAGPRGRSFSLSFTGPKDRPLAQRIHALSHDEIGSFNVFMVPHHADSSGQHYEVLFNRAV